MIKVRNKTLYLLLCILFLMSLSCKQKHTQDEKSAVIAKDLCKRIDADFLKIRMEVVKLSKQTTYLYAIKGQVLPQINKKDYELASNGCFFKKTHDSGAALWVSGYVPVNEQIKEVAYFTEPLDSTMRNICKRNPEVVQAYYNDKSSLNRIYPWFDVMAQYEPRMNIPEFNFYFLADEKHNPEKKALWVNEPYVDPAGRGWMVSAITPVYVNNKLEGVAGLDVTITTIVDAFVEQENASVAIFSRSGTLVAASENAISILEMPTFKEHKYVETIKQNTFKPVDYNIFKTRNRLVREMADAIIKKNKPDFELIKGKEVYSVTSTLINELDWIMLYITE